MGRTFACDSRALIPRAETELLVRVAMRMVSGPDSGPVTILDIGTGSGNLAVTLALELPGSTLLASDISRDALELARINVAKHGLAGRVSLHQGSLFKAFDGLDLEGRVDVVVCNPPYIPTRRLSDMSAEIRDHEPKEAFDGGAFGMAVIRGLLDGSERFLRPGGFLAFEIGAGQEALVGALLGKRDFLREIGEHRDAKGVVRVLTARRA
jgi:release factor glutamine methyltransferase